jgi:AAA+ ATPase superfamily predicted ATPase
MDEIMERFGEFVDRKPELKRFCSIIEEDQFVVMLIRGEKGFGKTSLQKRLIYECREVRKMRWAYTYWVDTRSYNYMTIMRMIRDALGQEFFQAFTDQLNYFTKADYTLRINVETTGTGVNILNSADLDNVKVNEIVGQKIEKIEIHDLNIDKPREDKTIDEQERMFKLTQQFLSDLTTALGTDRIVILIDDVEEMPTETAKWLWSELVRAVLDRNLTNIKFVFCADCVDAEPQLDDFVLRKVQGGRLSVLKEEHIREYLVKRKVGTDAQCEAMATMMASNGADQPLKMANMVTAFLERQRQKKEQEDE